MRSFINSGRGLLPLLFVSYFACDPQSIGDAQQETRDANGGVDVNVRDVERNDADNARDASGADVNEARDAGLADVRSNDVNAPDANAPDAAVFGEAPVPSDWPQGFGWSWVRENETFVSGLSVRMGAPTSAAVNRYFDDFGANAVHLWQSGMPDAINAWQNERATRWLSWVDKNGNSSQNNQFLGGELNRTNAIGYQVGDEPRNRVEFQETLDAFGLVKAAAPNKLTVFNYTYLADEIEAFLDESCASGDVDVFSYDRYSLSNSVFETVSLFRDKAIDCGVPYWRYLASIPVESSEYPNTSGMRWDAMLGVVFGYTGHTWFVYNIRLFEPENIPSVFFTEPDNYDSAVTPFFGLASDLNRELIVYGQAQRYLRSTDVGYYTPQSIPFVHPPEGVAPWQRGMGGDDIIQSIATSGADIQDVMLGFYEDGYRDTYVVVMNANREGGSFPNDGSESAEVRLSLNLSGRVDLAQNHVQVLRPSGNIENVALQNNELVLNIAAGDVVFYKYDSGNGFAGYR